jgi:redox-sensitive bicupin YhaK (pirin superfamily)
MATLTPTQIATVSRPAPMRIGTGFEALGFRHTQFDGLMDPLVMVDHYTMIAPTFGAHPHAGMSAVSILFEDSEGTFHNRDSLGNDLDLRPGDLYWLAAGAGAVHDEAPRPGARIHGLQVFVNLPASRKLDVPRALHVPATEVPVVRTDTARVRVLLGESGGVVGASAPALPLTVLDVHLDAAGHYVHALPGLQGAWLTAVRGDAELVADGHAVVLPEGGAVAVRTASDLRLQTRAGAHVAVLHGSPLEERFVQRGPFVMSTVAQLDAVASAFAAGRLGSLG